MGGVCSRHGIEAEYGQGFLFGNFGELEDLGVDGRMILKSTSRNKECVWNDFIWLRTDRSGWLTVMNLRVA
jgi:hypothetical protein